MISADLREARRLIHDDPAIARRLLDSVLRQLFELEADRSQLEVLACSGCRKLLGWYDPVEVAPRWRLQLPDVLCGPCVMEREA